MNKCGFIYHPLPTARQIPEMLSRPSSFYSIATPSLLAPIECVIKTEDIPEDEFFWPNLTVIQGNSSETSLTPEAGGCHYVNDNSK